MIVKFQSLKANGRRSGTAPFCMKKILQSGTFMPGWGLTYANGWQDASSVCGSIYRMLLCIFKALHTTALILDTVPFSCTRIKK